MVLGRMQISKEFYLNNEELNSHLLQLARICKENKMEYVIAGSIALMAHTEERFTKDIDFLFLGQDEWKLNQGFQEFDKRSY